MKKQGTYKFIMLATDKYEIIIKITNQQRNIVDLNEKTSVIAYDTESAHVDCNIKTMKRSW